MANKTNINIIEYLRSIAIDGLPDDYEFEDRSEEFNLEETDDVLGKLALNKDRLSFRHRLQKLLLDKYDAERGGEQISFLQKFELGVEKGYHPEQIVFLGNLMTSGNGQENINLPAELIDKLHEFRSQCTSDVETYSFHQVKHNDSIYNLAYVDTDNQNRDYFELPRLNEKPVILLLHGIVRDWAYWRRLVKPLLPHYQILIPDMNGYGDSAEMTKFHSIQNYLDYILGVLRELGVNELSVVGHSMGGFVAALLATTGEMQVNKTVIFSAAPSVQLTGTQKFLVDGLYRLNANLSGHLGKRVPDVFALNVSGVENSKQGIEYWHRGCAKTSARALAEVLQDLGFKFDLRKQVPTSDQSVLLITSHGDKLVPTSETLKFTDIFTQAKVFEMEKSGHDEIVERFIEENLEVLLSYLS